MISYFNRKGALLANEDSLTSTVIDLLKYLPDRLFLEILSKSLYNGSKLKIEGQEILGIDFWPSWTSEFPTDIKGPLPPSNINRVEPDVFIQLTDYDIIIEAKRWDRKGQSKDQDQVKREILAYLKENEANRPKPLFLIQLGGLNSLEVEIFNDIPIYKTDWSKMLSTIASTSKTLENTKTSTYKNAPQIQRVLNDLILGLSLYGFFQMKWLDNFIIKTPLDLRNINLKNIFLYASK